MNSRGLIQCDNLRSQLGDVPAPGLYVLNVNSTHFVVAELVLLKALLGHGNPGLFVSVDRPHQYIVHLLKMHGIAHEGLRFIDTVSRFSPGEANRREGIGLIKNSSHIDELPVALRDCSSVPGGIDVSQLRFAIIDNVSILLMYNSHRAVEGFLRDFTQLLTRNAAVVLVINRERYSDLYDTVLSLGAVELGLESEQEGANGAVQFTEGLNSRRGN